MEGGKHLDHNIVVALCIDSSNIYRESLNLISSFKEVLCIVSSLHFTEHLTYIVNV